MKTLNVHAVAALLAALPASPVRAPRPATRPVTAATTAAALEHQVDEIQHTFGVRWEW